MDHRSSYKSVGRLCAPSGVEDERSLARWVLSLMRQDPCATLRAIGSPAGPVRRDAMRSAGQRLECSVGNFVVEFFEDSGEQDADVWEVPAFSAYCALWHWVGLDWEAVEFPWFAYALSYVGSVDSFSSAGIVESLLAQAECCGVEYATRSIELVGIHASHYGGVPAALVRRLTNSMKSSGWGAHVVDDVRKWRTHERDFGPFCSI